MSNLPTQEATFSPNTLVAQRITLEAETTVTVTVQQDGSGGDVGDLITATVRKWLKVIKAVRGDNIALDSTPLAAAPYVRVSGVFTEPKRSLPVQFELSCDAAPALALQTLTAGLAATGTIMDALEKSGIAQKPAAQPPAPPQAGNGNGNHGAGSPPPAAPSSGVIWAQRAPSPNNPPWSPGQQIAFKVNRIVKGTNSGSVTYALWGPLGNRYPLVTIYQTSAKGDESADWKAVGGLLGALGLSVDAGKIEAHGEWVFTASVAHGEKDGKSREYLNAVSLTEA